MKSLGKLRKYFYVMAAFLLVLGMLPTAGVGMVFADDGSQPAVETQDEPVTSDPVQTEPATEVESPVVEDEASTEAASQTAEPEADVEELVELLSEAGVELADENGELLPLASVEAEEILSGKDPFFWNGSQWVGYTSTGDGCPANVVCNLDANPFQRAVNEAGINNTIYVFTGYYDEDVVVNTSNLSFVGFQLVTVDAGTPTLTINASGYAVVKSLTLNADFGTTDGVYADSVIVNAGGRLNDGLALANVGNDVTVEADVVIKRVSGDYFTVTDAHNTDGGTFEFECGEPDVLIYQYLNGTSTNPSGEYRMEFMRPANQSIVDYFTNHSVDERGLGLDAAARLEDLLIGVNLSKDDDWSDTVEKKIYWNLLGNMGNDANGQSTSLGAYQYLADSVTDGSNDTIARDYGIWFMWPKIENPSGLATPVNAFTTATELARQLTFITYVEPTISGCMDPDALNYNPRANEDNLNCHYVVYGCIDPDALNYDEKANTDDDSCTYPNDTSTTPPDPVVVPVTAAGGPLVELALIPVTGIELGADGANLWLLAAGTALLAAGMFLKFVEEKKSKS